MSTVSPKAILDQQILLCEIRHVPCVPSDLSSVIGIAISTVGRSPINGLRHRPVANGNGWYLWFGEEFSDAHDFFVPQCLEHLQDSHPEILPLLGLPPGYRFLIAGEHLDIWYDEALLTV